VWCVVCACVGAWCVVWCVVCGVVWCGAWCVVRGVEVGVGAGSGVVWWTEAGGRSRGRREGGEGDSGSVDTFSRLVGVTSVLLVPRRRGWVYFLTSFIAGEVSPNPAFYSHRSIVLASNLQKKYRKPLCQQKKPATCGGHVRQLQQLTLDKPGMHTSRPYLLLAC
jgi:hypothetical protein